VPLDPAQAVRQLWSVLDWLRQDPPAPLAHAGVAEIWDWAIANWRPARIAGQSEVRLP
jgi:hypothetical protein